MGRLRRRIILCLIAIPALCGVGRPAVCGEAANQGKNARVTWIDAEGTEHTAVGRKILYGYYERKLLSVPKDGATYKDRVRTLKHLPFADNSIRFKGIDTADFSWSSDEDEDGDEAPTLRVLVRRLDGAVSVERGLDLLGASHPESPFIQFTDEEDVEVRIPLMPLSTPEEREGKPRLIRLEFTT